MFNRLYIHVPFCIKKCNYCAFVSDNPGHNELVEYPELLLREFRLHPPGSQPLASIYFGGGTPSLLQPRQLGNLLTSIGASTEIRENAEITIEANPGTVTPVSLKKFRSAGINRISLGIQSFDNHYLEILGRIHTAEQSRHAFLEARKAGFTNISIDLIHSLPEQSLEQWRAELLQALALSPEHISIYGLTVEDGTPFAATYPTSSTKLADDDLSADMFELADELLTASGFEHYEIANYARSGYRSQHNSAYWTRDGYLGLGVAAHSFVHEGYGVRFSNPDNLKEYRLGIASGKPPRSDEQILTHADAMAEHLFLGLRLAEGVDLYAFERTFGRSLESAYGPVTDDLERFGLAVLKNGVLTLTLRGMLLSNQVFAMFL